MKNILKYIKNYSELPQRKAWGITNESQEM